MTLINPLFDNFTINETKLLENIVSYLDLKTIFKTQCLCKIWLSVLDIECRNRSIAELPFLNKVQTEGWRKHYLFWYRSKIKTIQYTGARFFISFGNAIFASPPSLPSPHDVTLYMKASPIHFSDVNKFMWPHTVSYLIGNSSKITAYQVTNNCREGSYAICEVQRNLITVAKWVPDDDIVTGGDKGNLCYWTKMRDSNVYQIQKTIKAHQDSVSCIHTFPYSEQINFIFSGGRDGSLTILVSQKGKMDFTKTDSILSSPFPVTSITTMKSMTSKHPTIRLFTASTHHATINLFKIDATTGKVLNSNSIIHAHPNGINEIQFNETQLVSCGNEKGIAFWKKEKKIWKKTIVFTPDIPISFSTALNKIAYITKNYKLVMTSDKANSTTQNITWGEVNLDRHYLNNTSHIT